MSAARTILLVEDEPTLQRILGSVLSDAGHVVESVGTAEQAVERLDDSARPDVDLVLSDKNLPAMNGLDLLTALRAREAEAGLVRGFVLVTGYPSRESALRVLHEGGDGYLVKPFRSLVHAMEQVREVLDAPLAEQRAVGVRARALAVALAGGGAAPPGSRVTVLLDDEALHVRAEKALARAGADLVLPESPDGAQGSAGRALVAGRVEDLLAFRKHHPGAALVLVDGAASFNDLLALIWVGGAALLDPVQLAAPA